MLEAKHWFEKALAALDLAKLHMLCEAEQEKVIFLSKEVLARQ